MIKKLSTPDYKVNDRVQERNKGPLGISNRDIRSENTRMLDSRKKKQKFSNNRKGTILDIKKKLNRAKRTEWHYLVHYDGEPKADWRVQAIIKLLEEKG